MQREMPPDSERLSFIRLDPENLSNRYLDWMNDYEVIKHLESRFNPPSSMDDLKKYVRSVNSDETQALFGIVRKEAGAHIGNIKIGPIDAIHMHAYLGILIGERGLWGQGYATEAIRAISDYSFRTLNLNHLLAGCYRGNVGSIGAFMKAGWAMEGVLRGHYLFEGEYVDGLILGVLNPKGVVGKPVPSKE
jgi:ribosomal-protein-alanine N-acetyltransferase